ncbi:MAG: carbonic anhydrase family protein [Phycisphaerales bacterium]|nr:carbonic anhydrase family protein [Phycisphaerales bacterium]
MNTNTRVSFSSRFLARSCTTAVLATMVLSANAGDDKKWGYTGELGPANWSQISSDCAVCADGKEQSPIDIPADAPTNDADIVFSYQPTAINLVNNGHTVQVNYDSGSFMVAEGKKFTLLQFHFHALSEHTIDGEHTPMEVHFVHQSDDGEYAVVGVMLERGAAHAAFGPVLANMPVNAGETLTVEGVTINASAMLPADQSYYRYAGSFTTPPCTEGVRWFVMTTPVELSDAQVSSFESLYDNNYRPVQPMHEREFAGASDCCGACGG